MTTTSNATNEEPAHPSALPLRRFIDLDQVQEIFSISRSQAYALVRSGELRAIQVGGRGQWRVELTELDAYIERAYRAAEAAIVEKSAID